MSEYSELKNQMEGLIKSLEAISAETESYRSTTNNLKDIAATMRSACSSMSDVVSESEKVYSFVNETAVKKTLSSFNAAAETFSVRAEEMTKANKELAEKIQKQNDELIAQVSKKMNEAVSDMKTKFLLMGGVSIACSLAALALAFLR